MDRTSLRRGEALCVNSGSRGRQIAIAGALRLVRPCPGHGNRVGRGPGDARACDGRARIVPPIGPQGPLRPDRCQKRGDGGFAGAQFVQQLRKGRVPRGCRVRRVGKRGCGIQRGIAIAALAPPVGVCGPVVGRQTPTRGPAGRRGKALCLHHPRDRACKRPVLARHGQGQPVQQRLHIGRGALNKRRKIRQIPRRQRAKVGQQAGGGVARSPAQIGQQSGPAGGQRGRCNRLTKR